MKLLFIGGTGLISSACSDLAAERGHEVFIVNRSTSTHYAVPQGIIVLQADVYTDEAHLASLLTGHRFDSVVDFLAYTVNDIERDLRLFREKTDQFVFISSASAYEKPPKYYLITEETPLENPYWEYSRNKIACEERLMKAYQDEGFPVTIIRPSLTYGTSQIPLVGGNWTRPYTVVDRMKRGEKVIIPGDGTSLWVLTWNADFVKGLIGLLGNDNAIGEAFHITSGLEANVIHSSSEMIIRHDPDKLGTLLGDKANSLVFDNNKIKRFVPDYHCDVKWAEALRRSLAWFEAHPEFQTIDKRMNNQWDSMIAAYENTLPKSE